ncbi:MAG TPA: DUF1345 domain-containing protein [Streptosporangiaceae bacterium]
MVSVVLSWTVVHTVFMLRYARAYYSDPVGGIEFGESDRRMVLHHALLSYLFGAVLMGLAINVVATLLR